MFLLELLSDGRILDLIAGKEAQTVFQILYLQSLCEAGFSSLCQNHTDGLMENSRNVLDLALIDIDRQDELAYMRETGRASCSRKMRIYAKKWSSRLSFARGRSVYPIKLRKYAKMSSGCIICT